MGGGGAPPTVQKSSNSTEVTVTNNITGPPINVNVGSEVLNPIAQTFQPLAAGLQNSLQSLSVGFQDAEVRRAQQEDTTAAVIASQQKMQQLLLYAVLGVGGFAALSLFRR